MAQTGPLPPYGEAIQQAVASGDVARMKTVAKEAEAFIAQWGNIPAALEALRLEIAKAEGVRPTPTRRPAAKPAAKSKPKAKG